MSACEKLGYGFFIELVWKNFYSHCHYMHIIDFRLIKMNNAGSHMRQEKLEFKSSIWDSDKPGGLT